MITDGRYEDLFPDHKRIFAYARQNDKQILLCINNYYDDEAKCTLPNRFDMSKARNLLSNYQSETCKVGGQNQVLRPYETRIFLIESN